MMRAIAGVMVLALFAAACGEDEPSGGPGGDDGAKSLTVYSSLPLQGAQRPQTTDMVKGIELALVIGVLRAELDRGQRADQALGIVDVLLEEFLDAVADLARPVRGGVW